MRIESFASVVLASALGCSAGSSPSDSQGIGGSGTPPASSAASGVVGSGGAAAAGGAGVTSGPTASGTPASSSASGGGFNGAGGGFGVGGGSQSVSQVYAHGPDVLYSLDPDTHVVTTIGPFTGCSQVTDIAIDKDGVMYGTTTDALYLIDTTTAACKRLAKGSYPNSLSLVPQGTLDPNDEALVGYNSDQYVRIDKTTGAVTNIGKLGGGYYSSGDIVSVIGGGTYLTVEGHGCSDCIVEVNPATGALVKMIGKLGHTAVYGLAFWGGIAYGFDNSGELFSIDLTNATTTSISTGVSVPKFWGAGSTTAAPLVAH